MRIAIIGAGWAGLTAAIKLHQQNHQITVFEAAKRPGGRARSIQSNQFNFSIDNGQHILIGAYHACFSIMRSLGIEPEQVLHRETLNILSADQSLKFSFLKLPMPFNQLGLLLKSHGLNGMAGRLFLLRIAKELHSGKKLNGANVHTWLQRLKCPEPMLEKLWEPLCIATCNTSIFFTDTNIFARILREALLNKAPDSDLYIPINLLDDLWLNKALAKLGKNIEYKHIREIKQTADKQWLVADQTYDRLIIATPFDMAKKLINSLPDSKEYLEQWSELSFSAIGTLNLELEKPWPYPHAMSLLYDNPENHAWGQWLFNRNAIPATNHKNLVHVVIGRAQRYAGIDNKDISQGVIRQIQQQTGTKLPRILNHALITEKKATFDVVSDLKRPTTATPWQGLLLAGDWTDTGYPAVLEGAVRSGINAATSI